MNIEQIREYCLKKKCVTEEFPFDEETLVVKVLGKIFILASLDSIPLQLNLKCDPEKAVELREEYEAVQPGYHMNKKHWNTIVIDGSIPNKKILEWIDHSYNLVAKGLRKTDQERLKKS
jgi:predicted DNA-binding protein (MmcQ/YjbR family)